MIYKFIDQVLKTKDLLDLFYKLMDPVWKDIEIKPKTYIHCYLDSVKKSLRTYYNGIRGFDDHKDLDYFEEKYTKTWKYPTGTLHYFWVGEENARTGDPEDYQNVYKFIPTNSVEYNHIMSQLMSQFSVRFWPDAQSIDNLMFTMMTPGTQLTWHKDRNIDLRFHQVIKNDAKTPSMIFKKPGEDEVPIPAKPGDVYVADVKIPHCVPFSKSTRLHLMGCIVSKHFKDLDNKLNRHGFLMDKNTTWTDWKKTI